MKIKTILKLLLPLFVLVSCDDYETYAEKKEAERDAISSYLTATNAKIITEQEFRNKLSTMPSYSGVQNNEWILLTKSSVYMQVVNLGTFYDEEGNIQDKIIKAGQTKNILCRFSETNLMTYAMTLTNWTYDALAIPESMTVSRTSDTFTGSFIAGQSMMYSMYGSTSVPTGWLVPLYYLNIGRCATENDNIAEVKLIVPHSQGQATSSSSVTPYMYHITYQEGK